jgi:nicotinamidase-related amidase
MKALIVIDMQNDFISGSLGTKEAQSIVPNVKKKIDKCRKAGYQIVYTRDSHGDDYLSTNEGKHLPVEHCIIGTTGWNITECICPQVGDYIIDKATFGFIDWDKYIFNDGRPNEIILVGLCTDICVVSNALILKAIYPETNITVDASCCAGVTPESHQAALTTMKMCQINVIGE